MCILDLIGAAPVRPGVKRLPTMLVKAAFLQKTDLSIRKQRLHILILCSLGIVVVVLAMLLVLSLTWPPVPRWYSAHYSIGRVNPKPGFATKQGLHRTRATMGSTRDDVLWFRVGTNVWFVEVMAPID